MVCTKVSIATSRCTPTPERSDSVHFGVDSRKPRRTHEYPGSAESPLDSRRRQGGTLWSGAGRLPIASWRPSRPAQVLRRTLSNCRNTPWYVESGVIGCHFWKYLAFSEQIDSILWWVAFVCSLCGAKTRSNAGAASYTFSIGHPLMEFSSILSWIGADNV